MTDDSISDLTVRIRTFAELRDWEQFHSPRNLFLALIGEVGELAEQFQWLSDSDLAGRMAKDPTPVENEVADIGIYLIRLADVLGIDLGNAISRKMDSNEARYDARDYRGSARKAPHPEASKGGE